MKKRFFAFWDLVIDIALVVIHVGLVIWIVLHGQYVCGRVFLVLAYATTFAVPVTTFVASQRIFIDLNRDYFQGVYVVNFRKNDFDLGWNWMAYPSEIISVTLVKLSRARSENTLLQNFCFRST